MKKNYILLCLALSLGLFCACDSFFDVNLKDQPTLEDQMSRASSVRRYLAHLYSYLPQDENVRDLEGGTVLRSDEALNGSSQYETYWYKVRRGDYSPATSTTRSTGNIWERYYIAINQCSIFLDNLSLDKEDTPTLIRSYRAEARFLRAYYYFILLRHYGPVIIWGDAQADQNVVAETLDRNTLQENLDFILGELNDAIADLPVSMEEISQSPSSNMGRATKGAAMALKSRILLWAASPLWNGQGGSGIYDSFSNSRGEKLFPAYDASKWEAAAQAAKAVIDMNTYSLVGSTQTLPDSLSPEDADFQRAMAAYQNVWFETWDSNPETIWGWWFRVQDDGYMGSIGYALAFSVPRNLGLEGYQLMTPSLKLVDSYPMAQSGRYPVVGYQRSGGLEDYSRPIIDEASGYRAEDWTDNYQQPLDYVLYDKSGRYPAWATRIKAHNSTIGRDARFYASLVPNGYWWPSAETLSGSPQKFTCYNAAEATSQWMSEGQVNRVGYSWRRLYKAGNPLKIASDYSNIRYVYPAFRMAEIYFNYAEACNEKPQRDAASATYYLDLVRARAGLNSIREAYPEIDFDNAEGVTTIAGVSRSNKEWLRWFILKEKMVEMAMEGPRHYDAIRWMIAEEEYPCENWTLHVRSTTYEDSYRRVSDDYMGGHPAFSYRDYLFPISSAQLAEMTHFTQNPGW